MKKAMFYEKREDGKVQCLLCPHTCLIKSGGIGFCRERKNIDGELYSLNYGRISSYGFEPIEKKPLYHFYPGRNIFSIGTVGCNFRCQFCQNWQIAQLSDAPTIEMPPEKVVELAASKPDNIGIAYTYSEPVIWFEYVYETARLARDKGLKNVLVTNGFIQEEPLKTLLPYIDAMNIDVKGFTEKFYKKITKGELAPVIKTVERALKHCHVEITTLVIPGFNDSDDDLSALSEWLGGLSRDIPLHFTRYFPNYKMDVIPTPIETLERAREIAEKQLDYVYIGNVWGNEGSNTRCPNCKETVVKREGFTVQIKAENGKCIHCGQDLNIIM